MPALSVDRCVYGPYTWREYVFMKDFGVNASDLAQSALELRNFNMTHTRDEASLLANNFCDYWDVVVRPTYPIYVCYFCKYHLYKNIRNLKLSKNVYQYLY